MKQLHKQSSNKRDEEMPFTQSTPYSPKSLKHPRSLPRSLNYILKEQRLLFILVGILVGSTFFIIQPTISAISSKSTADPRPHIGNREAVVSYPDHRELGNSYENHNYIERNTISDTGRYSNGVGRVPVGIGRKRKRIVVTGGEGFVGIRLVDKLIARGDDVIVIDNFFHGQEGECGAFIWKSEV